MMSDSSEPVPEQRQESAESCSSKEKVLKEHHVPSSDVHGQLADLQLSDNSNENNIAASGKENNDKVTNSPNKRSLAPQPGQPISTAGTEDSEACPLKSESKHTNESFTSTTSEDEFVSADEGSDSEEDSIAVSSDNVAENSAGGDYLYPAADEEEEEEEEAEDMKEGSKEEQNETEAADELEARKKLEETLTEEEVEERKSKGQQLKDEGNVKFRSGEYDEAILSYTEALSICPLSFLKERSIMYSNRAACKMKKEMYDSAIADSSSALELHPHYLKALLRRAELYEKTEKLDEALKDYQQVVELDPSQHMARAACVKLAEQIKDRNEKMKEEMMGKLKELGNMVLRPFGLSTNNFQMQQDPATGSYSMQFKQNPPSNGS